MVQLSTQQATLLSDAPVGHLSTASQAGAPHVIPVCFALDTQEEDYRIYIVLDQKPKRAALTRLRRVRNILENPKVALVVDHYDADWSQLWYILLTGTAELLEGVDPLDSEHEGTSLSFPLILSLSKDAQMMENAPEPSPFSDKSTANTEKWTSITIPSSR